MVWLLENRTTIQISEELRKELRILASKRDVSYQEILHDMVSVFKELDKERSIVSVPKSLKEKVEKKIQDTDMKSVSEYVTFLLRMILAEDSVKKETDESRIKEKLRKLGYL
jgi:Arc/MetJ-type ribon-helix-helix transcriptional regulator